MNHTSKENQHYCGLESLYFLFSFIKKSARRSLAPQGGHPRHTNTLYLWLWMSATNVFFNMRL